MAAYETACCGARVSSSWLKGWEADENVVCPRCKSPVDCIDDATVVGRLQDCETRADRE
jgi:DNA-directed RNA polymerase subunit RPC12/RpoP